MLLGLNRNYLRKQVYLFGYSLLLAHFFIALGRDDAFWDLFWQQAYYQDLLFVSLIVFVVSLVILSIWRRLDQSHPWEQDFKSRLAFQFAAGVLLPTFLSAALVYGYMALILKQNIFQTAYFYYELPVSLIVIVMLNLLLSIHYLLEKRIVAAPTIPSMVKTTVMVYFGNSNLLLDPEDISLVEREESICMAYTSSHAKYTYPHSLDQLIGKLPQQSFFRTNRQTIVHRSNCASYETERSGKLILSLQIPPSKKITISQKKAREFKNWLKGNQ